MFLNFIFQIRNDVSILILKTKISCFFFSFAKFSFFLHQHLFQILHQYLLMLFIGKDHLICILFFNILLLHRIFRITVRNSTSFPRWFVSFQLLLQIHDQNLLLRLSIFNDQVAYVGGHFVFLDFDLVYFIDELLQIYVHMKQRIGCLGPFFYFSDWLTYHGSHGRDVVFHVIHFVIELHFTLKNLAI